MKKAFLALVLVAAMFTTSCSTTWLSTFDTYVSIAATAVVQIITAIDAAEGITVNPAAITKINKDAAALQGLGESVVNATDANLPTSCAAFNEGVATFASDVPALAQLAQISNPVKLAELTAGITLVQGVIVSIEQPIAACQSAPTPAAARKALARGLVGVKSPSEFVVSYNKLGLGKKLHVNPWYVRYSTLDIKK
jgi:hypothetical protein